MYSVHVLYMYMYLYCIALVCKYVHFVGKNLCSFLLIPGPGDSLESPAHLATPSPGNITPKLPKSRGSFTSHLGRGTSPFTSPPDLDRSARDHLAGGPLSISGNYKDASGRVIKR